MKKISYLDGVRGFATLQVVLLHNLSVYLPAQSCNASWYCWQQWLRDHYLFFPVDGTIAVSLFFILSGYVLTKSFARTPNNVFHNILKRWVRLQIPIVAALAIASLLYFLSDHIHLKAADLNDAHHYVDPFISIPPTFISFMREAFWVSLISGFENISVFESFADNFFPNGQALNTVLWSMNIEFWGSVLIIMLAYLRANITFHIIAIAMCFLVFPMHSLLLFVLGHILACVTEKRQESSPCLNSLPCNLFGFGLLILGILTTTWREDLLSPALYATLNGNTYFSAQSPFHFTGMMAAIFVFLGIFSAPWLRAFFATKPLQKLGRISFAFYLLHFPILMTVTAFMQIQLNAVLGYAGGAVVSSMFGLAITLAISVLFTLWIDDPAIRLSRIAGNWRTDTAPAMPIKQTELSR